MESIKENAFVNPDGVDSVRNGLCVFMQDFRPVPNVAVPSNGVVAFRAKDNPPIHKAKTSTNW